MNKLINKLNLLLQESRAIYKTLPKPSSLEELEPYKNKEGYYISFTELDKLGINPKTPYNTPIGIYTYPLKEIWEEEKLNAQVGIRGTLPFGSSRKYLWIIKTKEGEKFLDLNNYSQENYSQDIAKLKEFYRKNQDLFDESKLDQKAQEAKAGLPFGSPLKTLEQRFTKMNQMFNFYFMKTLEKEHSHGEAIWQVSREMANCLKEGKPHVRWTSFLYKLLGYKGVLDLKGKGIIHPNEPIQAVFFTKNAFTVVKQIYNKDRQYKFHWYIQLRNKGDIKVSNERTTIDPNRRSITWHDGIWESGVWVIGYWADGTWKDGTWQDGEWYGGTWENGNWEYGSWFGGTWKKGNWKSGTWKRGEWHNGVWYTGIWEDGAWFGGTWKQGVWKKGTWHNGYWRGGTWLNGTWKIGWIYDPTKKGNFKEDWIWKRGFVRSPISPKEYFAKKKSLKEEILHKVKE